ncbi:Peptidyl-prolyl cis-trans isomerase fpr2 [Mactra antiquata]
MRDIDRKVMSCLILALGLIPIISCQMFDKRPTIYDHMKSGANSKKSNLIDTELKVENVFVPDECIVDDEDFYGERGDEINAAREKKRLITAEVGDTVTLHFKIVLDSDGTVIDESIKQSEELGGEDTETPAIFTVGYGHVIPGWEIGLQNICLGEIRKITIPPQLAYGSKGYKPKNIPPDATLEIESKLIGLKKKDMVDHYMDFIHNLHVYAFFILGLTFLLSGYYKGQIANKRRLYREIEEKKRRMEEEEQFDDELDDNNDDENGEPINDDDNDEDGQFNDANVQDMGEIEEHPGKQKTD